MLIGIWRSKTIMMTSIWIAKVTEERKKNPLCFVDGKYNLNAGHDNVIKCASCFSSDEKIGLPVSWIEMISFGLDTCSKCRRVITNV